jgi:hypothetical protein
MQPILGDDCKCWNALIDGVAYWGQRIEPVEQKMKPRANESQSPETKGNSYESHVKPDYITGQQRQLLSPG